MRCAEALSIAAYTMSEKVPQIKHCEIVGGLWLFLVQYAPPLMACFSQLWEVILQRCEPEQRSEALAEDFPPLFALLPMCRIQLDLDIDPQVTA